FSSRRRHTRLQGDWSSDVCSSDLRDNRVPDFVAKLNSRRDQMFSSICGDERFYLNGGSSDSVEVDVNKEATMPSYLRMRVRISRSEERRVGKEWRSRWWREDGKNE